MLSTRLLQARLKRDDGMTIVEVVVASFILFIIMTAVLSLLGQTLAMSDQATRMNVRTNAINTYVEWVRSLPYDQVSMTGGSIETTVVVTDEYTVTIDPFLENGASASLKNLYLTITVQRADGLSETFETMVVIRDRDQHLTDATRSPTTDPVIAFISPSPPDGTVIWFEDGGSWWRDAGGVTRPVQLAVRTSLYTDRTAQSVWIQTVQNWLLKNVYGDVAAWSEPTWEISPTFSWDLAQKDDIGEYRLTAAEDGEIGVKAYITDSADASNWDLRVYLVDTYAPGEVALLYPEIPEDTRRVEHSSAGSAGGTLTWGLTMDGGTAADHYEVEIYRQGLTQITYESFFDWDKLSPAEIDGVSMLVPTDVPFARCVARVRAESPRQLSGPWTDLAGPFVTRPTLAGSTYYVDYQNVNLWTVTPYLTASLPQFPYESVSYSWYLAGSDTPMATTTQNQYTGPAFAVKPNAKPPVPAPAYYARVTVRPTGATEDVVLYSETVYTTSAATQDGTLTFDEGTW
ncbi:MAG: hypothetical protein JXA36_01275 [Coriobacteriia bacterium]|nr:hypothetical protein [Coriobacteriia bacterium]